MSTLTPPHESGAQDTAVSTLEPLSETLFINGNEKPEPSVRFKSWAVSRSAILDDFPNEIYGQPVREIRCRRTKAKPVTKKTMLRAKKVKALTLALEHVPPGMPQDYADIERFTDRMVIDMFDEGPNEALRRQAKDFLLHTGITGKPPAAGHFEAERGLVFPVPRSVPKYPDHVFNQLVISECGECYLFYLVLLLADEIEAVRNKFDLLIKYAQLSIEFF